MKKFIFSDLDGTLVQGGVIKEVDLRKIHTFQANGNSFCIATGRGYRGLAHIAKGVNADYAICCNGALITDKDGNIVYVDYIDNNDVKTLISMVGEAFDILISDGFNTQLIKDDHVVELEKVIAFSITPKNLDPALAQAKLDEVKELNLGVALVLNAHHLDVGPIGNTKASGIKFVQELEKITSDAIMVVGDQLNDVSMFEAYEDSYCISCGNEVAKSYAKTIVDNVGDLILVEDDMLMLM